MSKKESLTQEDMENRLKNLFEVNSEEQRLRWAKEYKRLGKKVIGVIGSYVPEELIYAAGMLPWRIIGTRKTNVPAAIAYLSEGSDPYCTHVLESILEGELDFLDGVVATDFDGNNRALWDVCVHLKKFPFAHILHLPYQNSELSRNAFAKSLSRLKSALGEFGGVDVSDESISKAIEVYNRMRQLLKNIYDLRRRQVPPITGNEALRITTASFFMPKDEYNRELEVLLGYLSQQRTSVSHVRPRLLVSSDHLDDPRYLELIEETGALVAMDDLDTGSRFFWMTVDAAQDPTYALAKGYLNRVPCPRMFFWHKEVEQILDWVMSYSIDGVLHFPQVNTWPRGWRIPDFDRALTQAGVPHATFFREYYFGNVGQLQTRIQAFLETIR